MLVFLVYLLQSHPRLIYVFQSVAQILCLLIMYTTGYAASRKGANRIIKVCKLHSLGLFISIYFKPWKVCTPVVLPKTHSLLCLVGSYMAKAPLPTGFQTGLANVKHQEKIGI